MHKPVTKPANITQAQADRAVRAHHRSHMYVNRDDETQPLPSATVWEDTKTTRVTYRGEDGSKFRVIVRQLPNPIGITAKMPGGSGGKRSK